MVSSNSVGWGSYRDFEGPYFGGSVRSPHVTSDDSPEAKVFSLVGTTEGGHLDQINMYDSGILSAGLIQWIESGQYSVSDMLGFFEARAPELLGPLHAFLSDRNLLFQTNEKGRYRFFDKATGEVDTLPEQQHLFLLHSTGHKGTWDEPSKGWAKDWASVISGILAQPEAGPLQAEFTIPKMIPFFVLRPVIPVLFPPGLSPNKDMLAALQAIYLSFAANNPANAAKAFLSATSGMTGNFSLGDNPAKILRALVYDSGFTIYPDRYNKLRPEVERLYEVDIPDLASDLHAFLADNTKACLGNDGLLTLIGQQQALVALGYDLGPSGADGKSGPRTHAAILAFQQASGLSADGIVGPKTLAELSIRLCQKGIRV